MSRLLTHADYTALCRGFRWEYTPDLNMAVQCLAHDPKATAIIEYDGAVRPVSPGATSGKFCGDWLLTGDRGVIDEGYIRFVGRDDDVITSAGYRIGPSEIEDCLLKHPAVAAVGVVGKPDALRTEIVKAYVVLRSGYTPSDELVRDLQSHVKRMSAAHSCPREVAFLEALPMTVTGRVMRRELRKLAGGEA